MKKTFTAILLLASLHLHAQPCPDWHTETILIANDLAANITNTGNLFWKQGEEYFKIPYTGTANPSPSTIRKAGLWIGGMDKGGNLKVAASALDSESYLSDFTPGPLDSATGKPYENYPCNYFNYIWKVTKEEIRAHRNDWLEDGKIDNPIPAIMNWPGNGNPYFQMMTGIAPGLPRTKAGWAPFKDTDYDGIYDPMKGDFPVVEQLFKTIIPEVMYWTVFHDNTGHPLTGAVYPLLFEIQQLAFVMDCGEYEFINNTLFLDYKIISRSNEGIDSLFAGIWLDFGIGCSEDDYLGVMPGMNTFYAYNSDNFDGSGSGSCAGSMVSYGKNLPVQSVSFPNLDATKMFSFMYYNTGAGFPPGTGKPISDYEIYNLLSGSWKDGTPLTLGGTGYNPLSTNYTNFAFPGNPNDTMQWSMRSEKLAGGNRIAVGSVQLRHPVYPG